MIWLDKIPIPPSSNTMYETNVFKKIKTTKSGKKYMGHGTSRRKSKDLEAFQLQCKSFKNQNYKVLAEIREKIAGWIKQGFVLRVDTFIVFESSRIWTKENTPKMIDADNRRKALQDGLSLILDIDDKWFYSGNIEKVTCSSKEFEKCLVRIMPTKCRTLSDLQKIVNTADF